jgi:membrane associated rhomboid family serine protease
LTALFDRRFAVTHAIGVAMVAAWVAALLFGLEPQVALAAGFVPARLGGAVFSVAGGGWSVPVWLTPLSACFVHRDIIHVTFNLIMLIFCGRAIEPAIGKGAMLLLFGAGAYGAAIAEWAYAPHNGVTVIGASGAISAIVALYALLYNDQTVRSFGPVPGNVVRLLWLGAAWVGLQVLVGVAYGGQIAFMAHIGGFVVGLVLARPILRWRFRRRG